MTTSNTKMDIRHGKQGVLETGRCTTTQVVVIICFAVMFQTLLMISILTPSGAILGDNSNNNYSPPSLKNSMNVFDVPIGQAINLPSIRHEDTEVDKRRKVRGATYGGKGDKKHLGGFTEIDMQGISPAVWKHVVEKWTVQSVLDVGCGRGTSTSWFYTHGLRTQCVEGSHDAIEQSMLPDKSLIVEHDFSRGPWWPKDTFDAVWSVEFLEHVNVQFHYNYISTFRKAAILLVTSSGWGK